MIKNTSLIFAFFILTLTLNLSKSEFLQERLRQIDHKGNNYILRGNLPIDNQNKFQGQELKNAINKHTGLKEYKLIMITLLNSLTAKETRNKYIEQKYFEKNKSYGELQSYIVLGSIIGASDLPEWLRNFIAPYYELISFDKLNKLLIKLKGYLQDNINQEGIPTVVYLHCSAGVDRTGMIGGAYKMKYYNKSFEEVHNFNIQVLGNVGRKHMHFNAFNGMQWFCLNLGRTLEECSLKSQK